jgi:flagellar basal body-associated protein FliL
MVMSKKTTTTDPDAPEAPKSKSKRKLFIAIGLCAVLAGVAYMLVGRGGAADADVATDGTGTGDTVVVETPAALEFTEIVDLPAININLADGHYLRVAVSLGLHAVEEEAAADGHGAAVVDEGPSIPIAPAEDIVLATFSGRTMATLATTEGREEAKLALTAQIAEHYGAIVTSVFFTEFVMQ